MIGLSLEVVAWISVVLVQAILHFVVLGARRERIQRDDEDIIIEESLSLATNECDCSIHADDDDDDDHCRPITPEMHSSPDIARQGDGYETPTSSPQTGVVIGKKLRALDGDEPLEFLHLLSQTGSEMIKVSEPDNFVADLVLIQWLVDFDHVSLTQVRPAFGLLFNLPSPFYQSHSVERLVQEQIRARAQ